MKRSARRVDPAGIAFLLALYFAPVAFGALALQSSWRALAVAYAIWFGVMAVCIFWPGNGSWREKVGWVVGLGMFFTTPAVITLLLVMREAAGFR
ncbi:MAG TPA: hypothetical protein VF552_04505 [Allosphingosinicella sp.]|jgi:multidrug transporter EmrE-like cation transporter